MAEAKKLRYRLIAMGGLFAACLVVFFVTMFDAQIVHGADYREQSVRTFERVETVEASRGVITDRNGKVLVSNRAVYTLTFDPSLVEADGLNDALLRLIDLLRAEGVAWSDELPLTSAPPYAYDFDVAHSGMLLKYLASEKWLDTDGMTLDELPRALPAGDLYAKLWDAYELEAGLGSDRARALVGLRYSLATAKLDGDGTLRVASDVSVALISLLKDGDYAGVRVGTSTMREYQTEAAAHILGRVGKIDPNDWEDYKAKGYAYDDLVGREGVEAAFEDYLRGTDGMRVVTTNADGKVINELYSVEPQPGNNIALTLDIDFQEDVERILAGTTEAMTAEDGVERGSAAVVVKVGSGEVLASASYPTYSLKTFNQDYNELRVDPLRPLYNRATQGLYAPGSTFKPMVAVAALETGTITPTTKIRDLGRYTFYDIVLHCWIWPSNHGLVNVTDAITVSCNYFFYEVGKLTGISTLDRYAAAFGLGEPTGIEIPEQTGSMTSPDYVNSLEGQYWTDGLTLQAAIGQAYDLFTPLQLANYIATLAGGGTRYNAHLLKDVSSYDSTVPVYVYDEPPADVVSISDENLHAVLSGMRKLVTDGSVHAQFRDCVVDAAAKTGTAQTGGKGTISNGVFVAYAPYDDPQIAVAVVIEKGDTGGALAQTAVKILNAYFTAADPDVVGENTLMK